MGLVLDENANLSTWTASSENREQFPYVPSSEKNPYGFDFSHYETKKDTPYKTPYKYSHSSNMMRLANAKKCNFCTRTHRIQIQRNIKR